FAPPREFSGLAPEDRAEAAVAMRLQRIELAARNAVLAAQRDTLGQRVVQSSEQGRGYGRQADSTEEQLRLVEEQIRVLRPVADKGFV
ncbi:HlyD family type I secretion periplasmic adaptor subunit, partial [Escherichia coli]|nr:HlyD family type I secretion periplasmic adaptor subunit [Escherichia coli]